MKSLLRGSARFSMCLFALVWSIRLTADVTGSIVGAVRDSSGRVIPNAQLVATAVDTNLSKATSSESDGQYHLLALPAGRYRITVSAPGFRQFVANDVDLKVNDQLRLDATLSPGPVQESITVVANAVQVESESTQLGGTLESAQISAMPLNGRSYLDLLPLQPGVAPVTSGTIPNDRPVSGMISNPGNVSVNGQPESANQFLVNGGDVNEGKNMGAGLIPNLDSIQEFRLITNSYDAEYGKFSGAIVNVITKSGTNSIHGDAFEFLRNSNMDARGFFEASVGELRRNQFGYAVGGPLRKDKLFWFSDYQGTRQVQGADTGLIQIPTQAEKQGIFDLSQLTGVVQGSSWAQVLSKRLGYQVTNGEPY
ncbi:MAG TPA: carboxypeptidase regulatory-like domain-containing protein, partial [Bryobacteraceae bacterium]|nr:carboxypeptidase regulatory-like domain-containing protein [Bryobacteraceae bacterium]